MNCKSTYGNIELSMIEKKHTVAVLALIGMSAASNAAVTDYVQCHREKASFKQFCYINEAITPFSASIDKSITNGGHTYDLAPVIRSHRLDLLSSTGAPKVIPLNGLSPKVRTQLNFSQDTSCLVSDLWSDRISLGLYDVITDEFQTITPINKGTTSLNLDLDTQTPEGFNPVSYTENGTKIDIRSSISFKNLDHSPSRPLAYQRIPLSCSLTATDMSFAFSPVDLNFNNQYISASADSELTILSTTTVLHGNIIDSQNGAFCAPSKLADTLVEVEGAFDYEDLFFESQSAIAQSVADARDIGGITDPISADGEWDYFLSPEYQDAAASRCPTVADQAYNVSTAAFIDGNGNITNNQGHSNALKFERSVSNLRQLITGAFALIEANKVTLEADLDADWVNDSVIGSYLD